MTTESDKIKLFYLEEAENLSVQNSQNNIYASFLNLIYLARLATWHQH